ncbi:Holliday junction DNA helicase subunit RuvA [Tissierella praeacuta DSM 18095]|uniref:Holliday junction branch migration complex subunit RuvA n=1 Tax=Tissierella praeacuta DSM 18095 TaxID=1123404 RepID=A0A1M4ZF46_9FIRM|nr:Holliday junction branch migration protein RuvA [Tissierella praeacuta]TCU65363.1 Holliday junction DNA helicase subunit RuvA [Tissierella praeacuta]SHF16621.1 Holliday junction DNA helicase subunit RuvA [Tissierella praeacuta DSM 18095]SUP01938.1 Holliday junction ATP-dependent DNA helicase RuvA [Tissierella praeacuta]
MFEFIIGDIVAIREDYIVLQNNGIGYKIFTSTNTMIQIELGMKNAMIFTYLNVREDGIFIYGFISEEELNMFKLLQMVSKIGPKIALGILSTLNSNQIKLAIMRKDLDVLCKAPGIGKKTAERIILELKDRIDKDIIIEEDNISDLNYDNYMEAINGLMSLGYTRIEVEKIIKTMDISNMSIEDIIRETLKRLSKH